MNWVWMCRKCIEWKAIPQQRDTAYDAPLDSDDDDRLARSQYYLEDHSADPALAVESSDWQDSSEERLHRALAQLDERSRDILAQRWLADDKGHPARARGPVQCFPPSVSGSWNRAR